MKTLLLIIAAVAVVYAAYKTYRFATQEKGLAGKIANGAIILDVRTAKEYETGHIDGSLNISLGSIRERYVELDTSKTYITCCSHGLRSVKVVSILKEKGFKHVYNGGAWVDLEKLAQKEKRNKRHAY